jgi:hypothetical protein
MERKILCFGSAALFCNSLEFHYNYNVEIPYSIL